jgi:uncharacterized protein (TIGR02453 family)
MPTFQGFPPEALGLLGALPMRDRDWYRASKKEIDAALLDPAKALVEALGERLRAHFSPTFEAQPRVNGSISPLNEDLRFAPNKPPYRDYLMLNFWDGSPKKLAPTVRVRIAPDSVGFGGGMLFDKQPLDRFRAAVADDRGGPALLAALAPLEGFAGYELAGEALKRVPAPYDAAHPRAALLRHKMLQARWPEPVPAEFNDERFVDWCMERLLRFKPLNEWLQQHVMGAVHA